MSFFQEPPRTDAEQELGKPLELSPEEVNAFDEAEWYKRAYRGDVPQFTFRAVLTGSILGFFLAFTNIYIGLKTGWLLGVALTACILSFAIWGSFSKLGLTKSPMSILENNCMQSTASAAGYATGNTMVSAIPAMLMLSVSEAHPGGVHKPWYVLALWVFFLAVLGTTLAIPLKRNLINQERLKFPSGTAAAVTLQGLYNKGAEAAAKARALFMAMGLGVLLPLVRDLKLLPSKEKKHDHGLIPDSSEIFDWLHRILPKSLRIFQIPEARQEELMHKLELKEPALELSHWTLSLEHSGVLVAAGALVGLRTTFWMVAGGLYLAFVLGPEALGNPFVNAQGMTVYAATMPMKAWKEIGIWLGAPMLVASGLIAFAAQAKTMVRAFQGFFRKTAATDGAAKGYREGDITESADEQAAHAKARADVEVPGSWFWTGIVISTIGVVGTARAFFEVPIPYGLLAVAMTAVLGLVACRATGETDITPGGAMGKIMQLTFGKLIPQSTTANLMTAAITSGSALAAADLLNDLKSGYLLGASPRRQFLAQAAGIFTGTAATVLCFYILVPDASALGRDFPAPGAQQWKAVAEVFRFGLANLHPMAARCIVHGLIVGSVFALAELLFPKAKAWLPSPTGIGLGLTLPFASPLAMFLGALIAWVLQRGAKTWAEKYLVPIAAGAIAGESIVGVLVQALNNFVLKG
jgi:OPT family oligopeptide transporter